VTTDDKLQALVRVACEDALFAIAGSGLGALEPVARNRAAAHEQIAREGLGNALVMADFDAWLAMMVRTGAPHFAPWMVPMRDAIEDGLTLHREPRGLRAIIPIGLDERRARVRRDGIFALRVARSVANADSVVSADEARSVELLLAALGLSEEDTRILRAEAPMPMAAIELPSELEPKIAKAIVIGAWQVAAVDGIDEREHDAIDALAARVGVDPATVTEIGRAAALAVDRQRKFGHALLDVVRYILLPVPPEETTALSLAIIHLAIPTLDRNEALRIVNPGATTPLAQKHDLDRGLRERVLAGAWACALAIDPNLSTRAHLRARHGRAALHLDADRMAEDARGAVEKWLDGVLARGAAVVGV